ncbi:cyclopropane-fatty-acyl-phospholipid synthase family protein [Aquihabitans sp. G128]|uniref:SAM-dependent methyltransferase n=1 Tax=Aquihabitans sp. G128 TaxID=2849779 RepID=UPI001C21C992|nr:cyclopropane-fatty-acyl-phospholipid synthase family protein [Aquihabitans sp. G128]QXC62982.1 cyclopropane-fatty-acyl-phospholipid synthase family protein [Aquihabitans sp. G128]
MTSIISPAFSGGSEADDDRPRTPSAGTRLREATQASRSNRHAGAINPIAVRPAPRKEGAADRAARKVLQTLLARLDGGRLTVIEADGTVTSYGAVTGPTGIDVTVHLHTPAVWKEVALKASRGLGESYIDGWWTTDDLVGLVQLLIRNLDGFDDIRNRWNRTTAPVADVVRRLRPASKSRDKREIAAHYDLGNDFFELFLDPTMAYSCGLFDGIETSLEDAQKAKFDRLLRSIDLQPSDHLVEIGTGWGGLAVHAAQQFGARVTTCTISEEQHRHATELVARLGLTDQVTVLLKDYRDLTGTYDKLVSVEMIEAVDWRDQQTFFKTCNQLLVPEGRMALQAITVADSRFDRVRNSEDFIKAFVFPGSCIPSVDAITRVSAKAGDFWLTQLDEFPQHYAETLHRWRDALFASEDEARARGYGDALLRLWDFYLAYCEGAYRERYVSLVQCVLARAGYVPTDLEVRP